MIGKVRMDIINMLYGRGDDSVKLPIFLLAQATQHSVLML